MEQVKITISQRELSNRDHQTMANTTITVTMKEGLGRQKTTQRKLNSVTKLKLLTIKSRSTRTKLRRSS